MKNPIYKITAFLVVILIVIATNLSAANSKDKTVSESDLWQYKKWTKVNQTPMRISDIVAGLCAPIFPINKSTEKNPHRDKFITVYVNDVGKKAMFNKSAKFAIGSVIVKEKLPSQTSEPELMTVMIKREKGFNPESGDWEYLVLDPVKTSVLERGKLERCQKCHLEKKANDYIFRTYYYQPKN